MLDAPVLHLLLLWALYMASRRSWGSLTNLPASVFSGPSIFITALAQSPRAGIAAGILVSLAVLCFRWRWSSLEHGRELRVAYGALALLWVGLTAFMPYNLFFDHAWVGDRIAIVALAGLTLWRPGYAPLLLAASLLFVAQLVPSIDSALNWTEKRAFLDVQIAFASFLVLRRILPVRSSTWVLFALAVVAAGYWYPFLNKMRISEHVWSWALNDNLGNLFIAAHVDGFLPGLHESTALAIGSWVTTLSPLLCIGTLAIECAAVLMFLHHRGARAIIALFIAMHLGIFAASGIFFYKWIVVDLALLYLLWRKGHELFAEGGWPLRAAATALVVFAPLTLKPNALGWWDTKLSQVVRVEAVLADGSVREVSPIAFKPYDLPFVQGRVRYALDHATVVGALGAASSEAAHDRIEDLDVDGVEQLVARGPIRLEPKKAAQLDTFLRRFFANANKYAAKGRPLSWLPAPPAHIWHGAVGEPWRGEQMVSVQLRAIDVVYDAGAGKLVTLDDEIGREILITKDGNPPAPLVVGALHPRADGPPVDRGSDMTFKDACAPRAEDIVTLGLFGDVALHKAVHKQTFARGYASLLDAVKPLVAAADLSWVNLEGTIGCCRNSEDEELPDPGLRFDDAVYTSENKTGLNFHVGLAAALKDWGVDVVSTANNHSVDRRRFGIDSTLDALDAAALLHTGTRRAADEPWQTVSTAKGMTVAWLACTNWTNVKDPRATALVLHCKQQRDELLGLIETLAKENHAVVVLLHGGLEDLLVADVDLRDQATDAAEAGATVVATYHPHTMQTWEKLVTSGGREVPLLWNRGNNVTPVEWLEAITSTLTFVGLVRGDAPGAKARVIGAVHVPIVVQNMKGVRRLLPIDDSSSMAASRALALSRFGLTRAQPGAVPIDVRPECAEAKREPWQSGSGDLCTVDTECEAPLACVAVNGNKVCTQSCLIDADCPAAPGSTAVCVDEPAWKQRVCLRQCKRESDPNCIIGSGCTRRGERFACAPGESLR